MGEIYKAEIIAGIPEKDEISLYGQGNWVDLCRGPHVPSTGKLKAFKLTKVAGAYWRGDSRNEMLQRIYGTAWPDKKQLDAYLHRLEEAEKRDHRRIGKELDLFHLQEEAPGAVFWHSEGLDGVPDAHPVHARAPAGRRLPGSERARAHGRRPVAAVRAPREIRREHVPHQDAGRARLRHQAHELPRARADLQARAAQLPRASGAARRVRQGATATSPRARCTASCGCGLSPRTTAIASCTEEQITSECVAITRLILDIYRDFGFDEVAIKFADRPPKRVGER